MTMFLHGAVCVGVPLEIVVLATIRQLVIFVPVI
jgi:hypothetical protein